MHCEKERRSHSKRGGLIPQAGHEEQSAAGKRNTQHLTRTKKEKRRSTNLVTHNQLFFFRLEDKVLLPSLSIPLMATEVALQLGKSPGNPLRHTKIKLAERGKQWNVPLIRDTNDKREDRKKSEWVSVRVTSKIVDGLGKLLRGFGGAYAN